MKTTLIYISLIALAVIGYGGLEPAFAAMPVNADAVTALAIGGLVVNASTLAAAQTSFQTLFQNAFTQVQSFWQTVAMPVPSNTSANDYKWLGQLPGLRKWLGDKVVHNLIAHGYFLPNEDFELTIGVKRNDIEDDQLGVYNPLFSNMGDAAARHPDELVWPKLIEGFSTGQGFDKVPFFDVSHPVNGIDAADGTYTNRPATLGAGEPWFLMDDSRPVKPMIFQRRKDYDFVSQVEPQSENVFTRAEFNYGVEARVATGYGLPQLIYGSRQPLDAAAYEAARLAMSGLKRVDGTPLAIRPMTLVVGEGNFKAANILVKNERDAAGATNPWLGSAEIKKVDYLTGV